MSLFVEKKIENTVLEQIQLKELLKGESVLVYVASFSDRTSPEFGDFQIAESLVLDNEAPSISKMISSAKGGSFILNIMLQNMVNEGKIYEGGIFRIEKAWDKEEKFANGKRAKGYGYNVFELDADKETKSKLRDVFMKIKAGKAEDKIEAKAEPKNRVEAKAKGRVEDSAPWSSGEAEDEL